VLTVADAAALLQRATDRRGRLALLRALGFSAPVLPLGIETARRLGIDDDVRQCEVVEGADALRAIVLDVPGDASLRECASRMARRLATRTPELLWLVFAVRRHDDIALVVPAPGGGSAAAALCLDPRQVRPSDAESFAALEGARGENGFDTHLRWREALGRDALTRRFYRDLEQAVRALGDGASGVASAEVRRVLALRCASRLLFLAFIEAKGWLNEDRAFLSRQVASQGTNLHRALLEPLFFGTLNAPMSRRAAAARAFGRLPFLNGGLFTRDALEKRHRALRFADADIARIVGELFGRYRVTAYEESAQFAEAAVDPEMLGRAFESLMASDDRRNSGAFYTPPAMIRRITDLSFDALFSNASDRRILTEARNGRIAEPAVAARFREALSQVRILDPACGTGAFLVHALGEMSRLMMAAHDDQPEHIRRRALLARSIFGVDINPTAVWLCELRLWLAVVVDSPERDPLRVPPLPNLDRNIRCADTLAGAAFDVVGRDDAGLARLRERYARATGQRKRSLHRALDQVERRLAVDGAHARLEIIRVRRRDLVCALRGRDLFGGRRVATATERAALASWRREAQGVRRALAALRAGGAVPFAFATHFGDVARRGGFDLVIGNPPWVRLHRIPPADREALRARFETMRNAAWRAGASASGALTGFGMQADLAALFVERSVSLVRPAGVVGLLVPSKLLRSLAGGGLRSFLSRTTSVIACEDHAAGRALFEAAVYPAVLVTKRRHAGPDTITHGETRDAHDAHRAADAREIRCAVVRRDVELAWRAPLTSLPLDDSEGAPWLLLPPPVRAAFDALAAEGTALADTPFGRPLLGVKSGCNNAFVVEPERAWRERSRSGVCVIRSGERDGSVERALLRPALRGEDLTAFLPAQPSHAIIWTHDDCLQPLHTLPARAGSWLSHWRMTLERRADVRHRARWWSLFRLDAATPSWRVVWSDVGRVPRAVVLAPDDDSVPLNSCYAVRAMAEDDADALAAWINSPLALAWLATIAEPARGGFHRFLGWTMARLPLPRDWPAARRLLAPVGHAARHGRALSAAELHECTMKVWRLQRAVVEPLLTWMHW